MPRTSARERLLDAAAKRFYSDGVAATGIDGIIADAGVAKMSLYNNFSSKAELVLAYLEERHREWLYLYRARADAAAGPRDRALAVFEAYIDHASDPYAGGFRGCGLLNAAAEFPAGDPARLAVRTHKEEVEAILREHLARLADDRRAEELAELFCFLLEGAMVRAGLEGTTDRLLRARQIAMNMLDHL
ncbi:TetR/AcrR family transcriptional regulator [Leucobacter sp. CSA1]|uniref:TetR/AcrR family transcriptional regulator n=1 Tax=Leucobacter chromiisoli TaxID=2796471 RepID=A0A934Q5D5_9MICO|nr:TetR/AcrR family transcriptional regulator [Leucobacter chromiisoli]MBK0417953.1 TetR/AcrR family transcriptional regulator [Leucobacter chromiisoli]